MKKLIPVLVLLIIGALGALFLTDNVGGPRTQLHIVSGSENEALEPIVMDWARANGVDVEMTYLGSVDIARALSAPDAMP